MLRKVDAPTWWDEEKCRSQQHSPPKHKVYQPGTYEWTCPVCGKVTRFTVGRLTFGRAK